MSRWVVVARPARRRPRRTPTKRSPRCARQHYDLAVIDVMMPGHDGLWLAGELQPRPPAHRRHRRDRLHRAARRRRAAAAGRRLPDQAVPARALRAGRRSRPPVAQAGARRGALARGALDRAARSRRADRARHRTTRVAAGASETDALTALLAERDARRRRARRARRALRAVGGARARRRSRARRRPRHRGALSRRRQAGDAGGADLEAVAADAAARWRSCGGTSTSAPRFSRRRRSLAFAAPSVRASHEWFGGGGYPSQLAGTAIPFVSRIIAVADAYDAMTQDRAYRTRLDSVGRRRRNPPLQPGAVRPGDRRGLPRRPRPALSSQHPSRSSSWD